jgi:hypothetical protein
MGSGRVSPNSMLCLLPWSMARIEEHLLFPSEVIHLSIVVQKMSIFDSNWITLIFMDLV